MSVHERLKTERERLELSQTRFADLAKVGKTTVINWEKGASAPDALQLAAMAAVGADVLYVVTGQRSQEVAEIDLLPSDERVLVDTYRRCNPDARRNLIQTAALLAAGVVALDEAHQARSGVNAPLKTPAAKLGITATPKVPGKMVNKAPGSVQVGYQAGGKTKVINKSKKGGK